MFAAAGLALLIMSVAYAPLVYAGWGSVAGGIDVVLTTSTPVVNVMGPTSDNPPPAHCCRAGEVVIGSDQRLSLNSMSPILTLSRVFRIELSAPTLQAAAL